MSDLTIRATVIPLSGNERIPIQFHGWAGWIPSLQNIMDRYRRPGANGGGAQATGTESDMTTISAWRCEADTTTMQTTIASIEALQGLVCSVTDPWNRFLSRVRFHNAKASPRKGRGPSISGAQLAIALIDARFVVERLPDG